MKIAVMQPYIFPYIGYFQLINAVDKFVIFDDVNYKNKGWINRNNILLNGNPYRFTIPVSKGSQNKFINEIEISSDIKWEEKFFRTLTASYKKAPFFEETISIIKKVIKSDIRSLSNLLRFSILETIDYLSIETEIVESASIYNNCKLKGQERIIDICIEENAQSYINLSGGVNIYDEKKFKSHGIELYFLKTNEVNYIQFSDEFIPNLSIIDIMMFNDKETIKSFLKSYSLFQ